jgi:hypothetical protein
LKIKIIICGKINNLKRKFEINKDMIMFLFGIKYFFIASKSTKMTQHKMKIEK